MDAQRWQWIQSLFHEAAAHPGPARREFLATACAEDLDAMVEVLSLFDEDARNTSLLDRGVGPIAFNAIAQGCPSLHTIGPYRTLKLLGEGGMGVVYLAEREDLGSQVAIKILPNAWMSPARRERFALEERTQSRLLHPSIARLYDAGTLQDGTPWFAMEYVEGLPITQYCDRNGASLQERLGLFRSVCEAVQYAHQQAILHRDLKPSNILVKTDGTVRLLDFGIAKQLDGAEGSLERTRTGLQLATPAYAAPEQIRGEPAAIQADVYSLGMILYELCTGRLPFSETEVIDDYERPFGDTPDPEKPSLGVPRTLFEGRVAWSDLDVLCLTAIHKDIHRRYQSVEALIRDIDHFLLYEPLEARADNFRYKLGKFVRRNRWRLTAVAVVFATFAGMAVYFTLRLAVARDAALAEAARTQRIQQFMMHLFEGGDADVGPTEDLRVVTLIDRSAREAQALNADPAIQADLYQTLGNVYDNLGKLDRAEEFYRVALEKRKQLPMPDNSRLSENLILFGLFRVSQGKLDEAEKLVREGLQLAEATLPAGHPQIAASTSALGRVLMDRGDYDKAVHILEEAVRLQPAGASPTPESVNAILRLANAQYYLGHYEESERLNRRVVDLYSRLYGERHPMMVNTFINLGAISQQRSQYGDAERSYREAFDIARSHYGASHPETAAALMGVGRALLSQKRLNEAELVLQDVLAIRERAYGPVHPNVASTITSLGTLALEQGQLGAAENYFRRSLEIYRTTNGERHHFVALALSNLGGVYLQGKDYSRAEKTLRSSLQLFEELLPADHTDTGVARVRLGRVLVCQSRHGEAEDQLLRGLRVLEKNTGPASPWIKLARQDLASAQEALGNSEKASQYSPLTSNQ